MPPIEASTGNGPKEAPCSKGEDAIARAREAALRTPKKLAAEIRSYGITDQDELIRLAEIIAAKEGSSISEHIRDWGIKDQAALIRIAKAAAANSGGFTSFFIQNYGIDDLKALAAIAKIAAHQDGRNVSWFIQKFGIVDQDDLIAIAKIAAAKHGEGTSEYISNYAITDPVARAEIAEIAAAQNGWATSHFITRYGITDSKALIRIARVSAAQDGGGTSRWIANYSITDPDALIEIAEIAASQDGRGTSESIDRYNIKNQDALIRIAMKAALQSGADTAAFIDRYGIVKVEDRIKIAEFIAQHDGRGIAEHIEKFEIDDLHARIKIAEIAAAQNGMGVSEFIRCFGITDPEALARIAEIAATQSGEGVSIHIANYGIRDPEALTRIAIKAATQNGRATSDYIKRYGITDQTALIKIAGAAAAQDGEGTSRYIQNYGIANPEALVGIAQTALHQSLKTLLYQSNYRLPPEEFHAEVITPVFSRLLSSLGGGEHGAETHYRGFKASIEDLCQTGELRVGTIGIDTSRWESIEPHERVARIATWLKTLAPELDDSLFDYQREVQAANLAVEALVATVCSWRNADVARYGNRGRAALAVLTGYESIPSARLSSNQTRDLWGVLATARDVIGPNLAQAVPVSFASLPMALETITLASALKGLGGEIPKVADCIESNDDFDVFNKELKERIKEQFQKVLNLDSLDEDKFAGLLSKWGGDITPFTVLAGRFNSRQEWLAEIPVLSDIAKRCLDGSFHDWRYRTDDGQLSMLSEEGLRGWRENPVKLQEHVAGEIDPERAAESLVKNIRQTFETNIIVHLPTEIAQQVRLAEISEEERLKLLSLGERDFAKQVSLPKAIALIQSALNTQDPEQIRQAVRLVNGTKESLLKDVADNKQLRNDLKTLNDHTKVIGGKAGSRYYVLSTITDDPKLLLMAGDLVQSASCQNYRSGSHIETLPGYVIDGNIKLALSYVIKAEVIDKYPGATFEFDAAKQVLNISGTDDVIPLGYALRREVIRLGAVDSEAVVLTEPAYLQNHAIAGAIEAQQRELIGQFCRGASVRPQRPGETATFATSRNPSGVYTDAGGGIRHGEYSITCG